MPAFVKLHSDFLERCPHTFADSYASNLELRKRSINPTDSKVGVLS